MPAQFPSIQSFYPLTSSPSKGSSSPAKDSSDTSPADIADGFTSSEVDTVLYPSPHSWTPPRDYDDAEIETLVPGPQPVHLTVRIVNFFDQQTPSKMPQAAKGCIKIIVKDDTGAMTVRLWYAKVDYKLRFGHLVSIWTTHISTGDNGALSISTAPLFTSIFPERDRSCCFMIQEHSDIGHFCKRPLEYYEKKPLPGLMTLKNFVDGGNEIPDSKILVCVKSIGPKKKITLKSGDQKELCNVVVFDHTANADLTLWGPAVFSTEPWKPSETVLLISRPRHSNLGSRSCVTLTAPTFVDVDPSTKDAVWLRSFAQKLTKRDHVNPTFPEEVFDLDTAQSSEQRVLYRLADIDEFVRAAPQEVFIGFLSVVILDMHIALLHMRNMLFCDECCGVPMFSNKPISTCKQCDKSRMLRQNPRMIANVIDETGQIDSGKLLLSPIAWIELLGRNDAQLAASTPETLRYLDRRMTGLRLTLIFGWAGEATLGGRLSVLGVRQ